MTVDKVALRAAILAGRADLSTVALAVAATAICHHVVEAVRSAGAARICAYLPVRTEPGSMPALDELRLGGVEVLLPVLRDDFDLDWARYEGPATLVAARRGLREPVGRRWGPGAISAVDLAIVPALAVDRTGNRLGRGGGSYDRALARLPHQVPVIALLHDGEVIAAVPHDDHDRPVTHTVTPAKGCQQIADHSSATEDVRAQAADPSTIA